MRRLFWVVCLCFITIFCGCKSVGVSSNQKTVKIDETITTLPAPFFETKDYFAFLDEETRLQFFISSSIKSEETWRTHLIIDYQIFNIGEYVFEDMSIDLLLNEELSKYVNLDDLWVYPIEVMGPITPFAADKEDAYFKNYAYSYAHGFATKTRCEVYLDRVKTDAALKEMQELATSITFKLQWKRGSKDFVFEVPPAIALEGRE